MTKIENITSEMHKMIDEKLSKGERLLPTESELCTAFSCSRQTIRKVLLNLKEENLISSRRGSGHYLTGLSYNSKRNHICLLFTRPDDYIYPTLIYDIEKGISSASSVTMAVSVNDTGADFYKERTILKKFLTNPPRIILSECFSLMPSPNADIYRELEKKGCNVIFLYGTYPNLSKFPCIKEGTYDAVYDLVRRLHTSSHTHIRGVFKTNNPQEQSRFYGFLSALRDYELPFDKDSYIIVSQSTSPNDLISKSSAKDLESLARQSDALIFCNDEIAYPCVKYLKDNGCINLGEKPVYSFDNSFLSRVKGFRIPSFYHCSESLAGAISEMINSIIKGQPKISIVLPYSIHKY
ncbi:MAG: GntR family transcriptional regulator [Butyrivibrio sp.]|nr:GntR family transcriptional regulator [Butyrivibrio sp.]